MLNRFKIFFSLSKKPREKTLEETSTLVVDTICHNMVENFSPLEIAKIATNANKKIISIVNERSKAMKKEVEQIDKILKKS